ncbi:hypothetical protein DCC79_12580 [bacterium]|nr:MAG: hypothetical protein DCC79_12580 [bacterium]
MPALTRWYIKTALAWLVLALIVGVLLGARGIAPLPPVVDRLAPAWLHLVVFGWVAQLIFGVVHWMFPHARQAATGLPERLGWATYGLLNAGLVVRVIAEPFTAALVAAGWGWLLVASALAQLAAGWLFVATTWRRVVAR